MKAFQRAKIMVNNLYHSEIWGVNVRTFEPAGAGSLLTVDWRPWLEQLFVDGRELVAFRGVQDLKERIDYRLPRESERREIARACMRRADAEHTYRLRLALRLRTLGGIATGFPLPRIDGAR